VIDGILLLDKPLGVSSNAALQRVRRALGADKAGHVGSLDPLATGMLPICLGEATKVAGEILAGRKCYRFTVQLGARTSTGDVEGEVVERGAVPALSHDAIDTALAGFLGRQPQVPPMYSAIKRGGQPLYRLARAGLEVERSAREIEIHELRRLGWDPAVARLELEVVCSKGTYVRVLAEDVARALGTCGHVVALRREYVEPFAGSAMQALDAIEAAAGAGTPPSLLPPDAGLPHLPAIRLESADVERLAHGQPVRAPAAASPARRVRLYGPAEVFLGLGEVPERGVVQPRRLLARR
jgi:tRNA pseudouridine55 synthase